MHEIAPRRSTFNFLKLDPAELLDRRPHLEPDRDLWAYLQGQTVLVTGAGGSIGSELCRQISQSDVRQLVMVDRSENALFDIDLEMRRLDRCPGRACLHDVTHQQTTQRLFSQLRPDVVIHAAAHKHVPMMEDHPVAAVENNFYGTRFVVDAAQEAGAPRLVMISTDKAVQPASIMGATKRLAELYVQQADSRRLATAIVRFGNVLGSACSVLPIWTRQLFNGGPITVTDPAMERYFMTIPEAAGLVLCAGGLPQTADETPQDRPADIFVLDMGEPVRVLELALRFCRSQGLEPGRDIQIEFTGKRPGEKLTEQLTYSYESMHPTAHPAIRRWRERRCCGATPTCHKGKCEPLRANIADIATQLDQLRGGPADVLQPWRDVPFASVVQVVRQIMTDPPQRQVA